jgi:two-component sensor histidine kinase
MAAGVQDRDRRLRDALAQKTLMIKETHHRVKNNLQIVMSLLSLQAGKLRDPAAQTALRQAQVRVNALALVHRTLYEIENLDRVDLQHLLKDLVHQIHDALGGTRRDITLETEFVSRQVTSDIAVPLTLFTVEALTNAFKHAFPVGGGGGTIRITLKPTSDAKLKLEISDDGTGRDHEAEPVGIGSRLIQAFAQQVNGQVTSARREGSGTVVTLVFPDPLFRSEEDIASETGDDAEEEPKAVVA